MSTSVPANNFETLIETLKADRKHLQLYFNIMLISIVQQYKMSN